MNRKRLEELIDRMVTVEKFHNSENTVSWGAYREAEKLTDTCMLPILEEIIHANKMSKERRIRDGGYFIYGKILKNSFDADGCAYLVQQLYVETDKYILSHILEYLADVEIPTDIDIFPIIYHAQSEKWLVRHAAICALGSSATQKSREALAYYIGQKDEKTYQYEIVCASIAMGKIGIAADIPLLEKHLHSKRRNLKNTTQVAIEKITARCRLA